jgi:uncharacterized small protein (DUF1192 family)
MSIPKTIKNIRELIFFINPEPTYEDAVKHLGYISYKGLGLDKKEIAQITRKFRDDVEMEKARMKSEEDAARLRKITETQNKIYALREEKARLELERRKNVATTKKIDDNNQFLEKVKELRSKDTKDAISDNNRFATAVSGYYANEEAKNQDELDNLDVDLNDALKSHALNPHVKKAPGKIRMEDLTEDNIDLEFGGRRKRKTKRRKSAQKRNSKKQRK